MRNTITWFEIPVIDMARAVRFYEALLGTVFPSSTKSEGSTSCRFPHGGGVGGALISGEGYVPGASGAVIYLNCRPSLDAVLSRVEAAGGKIIQPKTDIGEYGFSAFILDTEANRIGLHEAAPRA